jgi:hypothetical protein
LPNDILSLEGAVTAMGSAERPAVAENPAKPMARAPVEILGELANRALLRAAGEPAPLASVTLHLRGGRDFRGIVRSVAETKYGVHILLDPSTERVPSKDRIYIPCSEVQAITDHGVGPDEPVETAPTLLEFRRHLADWEAELRLGFLVPIAVESDLDQANLGALEALLGRLRELTAALALDREAYKSFARAVQKIELGVAGEPSLTLVTGALRATTCLDVARRMRTAEISQAIEALL